MMAKRVGLDRNKILALTLLLLCGPAPMAHADCTLVSTGQQRPEGYFFYNKDHKVMQYCDGTSWRMMMGGGIADPELADLTDVDDALAPADGSILTYDSVTGEWVAGVAGIGAEDDPEVGATTNGQWCRGNGTQVTCDQDAPSEGGATAVIENFTSSGIWNKPAGLQYVIVEAWGAGGGGGGCSCSSNCGVGCENGCSCNALCGRGGGGAYARKMIPASSLGASVAVTVGGAGSAGAPGGNGGPGGDSSFGAFLTAGGGGGGLNDGTHGADGTATGGDINVSAITGNAPFGGVSGDANRLTTALSCDNGSCVVGKWNGSQGQTPGGGGGLSRAQRRTGSCTVNDTASGGAGALGQVIVTSHIVQ